MRYRSQWIVLALLALAACGSQPAATPPSALPPPTAAATASATAEPTAAPTTAAAPTAPAEPTAVAAPTSIPTVAASPTVAEAATVAPIGATAAPTTEALLPAPLYVRSGDQIWRLERDGATVRQVTAEILPVGEYDVGPSQGDLAYMLSGADADAPRTLVYVDPAGAQRSELVSGPVGSPLIEPGGDRIAFHLFAPVEGWEIGKQTSGPGVWATFKTGGRPGVVQPSEPIPDPNNPPEDARQYAPIAWSPDGSQLLLGVSFPVGEGGTLAVKRMSDGALLDLDAGCCEAAWSVDGAAITIAGGTQIQDASLGLWRADPHSGATTALIPGLVDDKSALITAARQLGDGQIYAFLTFMQDPPFDQPIAVTMQRVGRDGTATPLRSDSYAISEALWADDASGAVVVGPDDSAPLLWLPADGGPAVALPVSGSLLRWGPPDSKPSVAACPLSQPLTWQPPGQRSGTRLEAALIRRVQQRLRDLGYAEVGAPDGLFGDATREAVKAFQRASALPDTGDVDCATALALFATTATHKP